MAAKTIYIRNEERLKRMTEESGLTQAEIIDRALQLYDSLGYHEHLFKCTPINWDHIKIASKKTKKSHDSIINHALSVYFQNDNL